MIIYLVRHAESAARRGLAERETLDIGLSSLGILQAKALAPALKSLKVERIVSSPIARAAETARLVAEGAALGLSFDERLGELLTTSGETREAAIARLRQSIEEIAAGPERAVALITHRVVVQAYLEAVFGYRGDAPLWMHNGAVSAIEYGPDKKPELLFVNKRFRNVPLFFEVLRRRIAYLFK
jgi:broad specificity phosphatase PhoE